MYNSTTEFKIKQIPQVGNIDIDRLPQELTRIYAQIVGIRRQFADGTIEFQSQELRNSLQILQTLANNLETILISIPSHERKESIAFVSGTAHSLIHKMELSIDGNTNQILEANTVSPLISAVLLFLIGNSQADAAEMADQIIDSDRSSPTKSLLISYIKALAKGNLTTIINNPFREEDINLGNLQEAALDYLWRELGLGIHNIASNLLGVTTYEPQSSSFDRVIDLSVTINSYNNQRSVFAGPLHLSKLLRIINGDILNRAVININPPLGIEPLQWKKFLGDLAQGRPYLWENHKEAVFTNFLENGISAVLTLPTGAGKSTLSELKIASCIFSNKNVIYLVPTHALKDQVDKSLKSLFSKYTPENFDFGGEFTELDLEEVDSFPVFVMTPERCITLLNVNPEFFETVGLVVFDEFHLIHGTNVNRDRRAIDAMYCLISLFKLIPNSDYLLISAMVENGNEIAEWVNAVTGRECKLFNSSWKPTRQLHGCLIFDEGKIDSLNTRLHGAYRTRKTKHPPAHLKKEMTISPFCFFSLKNIWETSHDNDYYKIKILDGNVVLGISNYWKLTTNRNDIAAKLGVHFSKLGLKTLIFVDEPRIALSTAKKISEGIGGIQNSYEEYIKLNVSHLDSLKLELGSTKFSYFENNVNVGVHHGLLLPIERGLIEQYFKQTNGSIALVATATLAQGINLPAEIVIIAGDDRFDEDSKNRERVPPHELLNAAGRAGRAGQSSQGAVILIPGEIVTINDLSISNRWWSLKNDVFSKSDQCLKVEDPLEYFLDSIQDEAEALDINQINVLYRFKAGNLSETDTENLLKNSLYSFKATKGNKQEEFNAQVNSLLRRRNQLDALTEDIIWIKEVSFKTGIDPSLILLLSYSIDKEDLSQLLNYSVIQQIEWFFGWLQKNISTVDKIYTKPSTIIQIKKAVGVSSDTNDLKDIANKLPLLKELLISYVRGAPLEEIDQLIPGNTDMYLTKARNFVIRLIPEISFSFGLLSMILVEKARQKGIEKQELPKATRALASCIREGFDEVGKLYYKRNKNLMTRVETHIKFDSMINKTKK